MGLGGGLVPKGRAARKEVCVAIVVGRGKGLGLDAALDLRLERIEVLNAVSGMKGTLLNEAAFLEVDFLVRDFFLEGSFVAVVSVGC